MVHGGIPKILGDILTFLCLSSVYAKSTKVYSFHKNIILYYNISIPDFISMPVQLLKIFRSKNVKTTWIFLLLLNGPCLHVIVSTTMRIWHEDIGLNPKQGGSKYEKNSFVDVLAFIYHRIQVKPELDFANLYS